MTWLSRLLGKSEPAPPEAKQQGTVALYDQMGVSWGVTQSYQALSREGYMINVIANRCVTEISGAVAAIPWSLMERDAQLDQHPLLALLGRPNPMQGGAEFFEALIAYLQISGNSYVQAVRPSEGREPTELWTLRPDRMEVLHNGSRLPTGYRYTANFGANSMGPGEMVFPVDQETGASDVLHVKSFHPVDDWYGYANTQAAGHAIDQHNAAGTHNASLLQNGARVGGAWIWEEDPGEDQRKLVETILLDRYQSPRNAGKPMVLGGKGKWQEMALSPKDMDFNESTLMQARDICAAFGVPHLLVVPGESTYNNRESAYLELWEQTIIPLIDRLADSLNNWLTPMFGEGLRLAPQYGDMPALAPRRTARYQQTVGAWNAGLITRDEARQDIGYDAIEGDVGDDLSLPAFPGEQLSRPAVTIEHKQTTVDPAAFVSALDDEPELQVRTQVLIEQMLDALVMRFGEQVVQDIGRRVAFESTERVQEWVRQYAGEQITRINDTTRRAIRETLGEGIAEAEDFDALTARVRAVFKQASESRARMIATTETTAASGVGSDEAIRQSGLTRKQWLTTQDNFARDTHESLHGQVVDIDGRFQSSSGAQAARPGGFGVASEDINCRCSITAYFDESTPSILAASPDSTKDELADMWHRQEARRESEEAVVMRAWRRVFAEQERVLLANLEGAAG